jgi:uncharacterized protein
LRETFDTLMKLQSIDCKLRKLESIKGDLPQRLQTITDELSSARGLLSEKENEVKSVASGRQNKQDEIVLAKERLKKYQAQLYQVKNNREYDAITVEIENTEKEIEAVEFQVLEDEEALTRLAAECEALKPHIEELHKQQAEHEEILEKTLAITHDEEEALLQEREAVVKRLSRPLLSTYDRIRVGRSGLALALLKDSACSECSSRIPPQRGLEIRQMDKMYLCEVCGRIMIWSPDTEKIC